MIGQDDKHLRYVHRGVGLFMIGALVLALVGFFQSGRIERWFSPLQPVKVILPQQGLHGLSAGASVEILGTDAGEVQAIVIDPNQQIHANVLIRRDMRPFVRQDSKAYIRKRFGVAGDSYLQITRGTGAQLDWDYAVLQAHVDRSATDMLQSVLDDLRNEAVPLLKDTRKAIQTYTTLAEQLNDPEGTMQSTLASLRNVAADLENERGVVGRLIGDDKLAEDVQKLFRRLNRDLAELEPLLRELQATTKNLRQFSGALAEQGESLPQLNEKVTANLEQLRAILDDLGKTTPRLPEIADQVADTTTGLPGLVVQAQTTLLEVQKLVESLRSSWLIGGKRQPAAPYQLSPEGASP